MMCREKSTNARTTFGTCLLIHPNHIIIFVFGLEVRVRINPNHYPNVKQVAKISEKKIRVN